MSLALALTCLYISYSFLTTPCARDAGKERNMVRRNIFLTAVMLIVAVLAVACVPQSLKEEVDEHAYVWFGFLEAKGVNTDVYTSDTSSGTITGTNVAARAAKDLYWAFKAVKNANSEGFAYGNTGGQFLNVAAGTGLGTSFEFSKGKWDFELVAYTTSTDRTNQTSAVYKGSVTGYEIKADGQVTVPVDYAYADGNGTANFVIKADITQDALGANLASVIGTYKVTGVKAYIGGLSTNLTQNSTSGNWVGTINNVPYGLQNTKFEVYIANETTARVTTTESKAAILANMETTISGTANIHLNKNTAAMTFIVNTTSEQPKLYEIHYNLNGGTLASGSTLQESCKSGDVITLPTLTKASTTTTTTPETTYWTAGTYRTDYTFAGWKVNGTADSTASTTYTAQPNNVTLEAVFTTTTTTTSNRTCKLSAGSTLTMGKIPSTDATYGGQDITWKVLEVDSTNKRALVISEKLLKTMKPYTAATLSNYSSYPYSWADCDINTYLNGSFIAEYGLSNVSMASVPHETEYYTFADSSSEGTAGTATTSSEKVFLLSVAEVNSYFADNAARAAQDLSGSSNHWWLRSPGSSRCFDVAFVLSSGSVNSGGRLVDRAFGLRPAFWINL